MPVLKCKMCGAQLDVKEGQKTAQCRYCDSIQTIPKLDNEFKLKMFERATELRLQCEFDQASSIFQSIVAQFPDESEAYWGVCLCKYGIEYVDDPNTLAKIPTCHRTHPQSILSDPNYLSACEYADSSKYKYEEEAQKIDILQKKILDISRSESPYDIFICYKETDDKIGIRTDDSVTAQDIYTELVKSGYRVFYSRVTLRGKAGGEYEPYIYAALASARIMLVLGSKKSYFDAVWVKNEWSRFLDMMQSDSKTIIPCYEKINANDIPVQLRNFQALDMGNKIFFSDLTASIERIIPRRNHSIEPKIKRENDVSTAPQQKEFNYDDGVYIGEALGNRPHGYGTRFFDNGDKYEGNWNMGTIQGEGTFSYGNGDSWSGEWNNGKAWNGSGKYHFKENDMIFCYEGILEQGKLNGEGKRYTNGKITREGYFINGVLNGNGISYMPHGETCSGEFKEGWPYNAEGTYPLKNFKAGCRYTGKWENGIPVGKGSAIDNAGAIYSGEFSGELTGNNLTKKLTNGVCYIGKIEKGQSEGFGKLYRSDGSLVYEGEFKQSQYHGKGTLFYQNGNRYEGEFSDGKFNGQGTFYYQQGSWSGEWKDDKRWKGNGLIMYYDKDGKQPTGKFFNGYMVNGKAAGKGILRFEDGSRFDGEFFNDNYYNGTVYNSNNQIIDTYINGVSQQQKAHNRNQAIAGTALGILRGFTGI